MSKLTANNKKPRKSPDKAPLVVGFISVARLKQARERRGKLPKAEYFGPRQPLVPLT
jgi:hypothetical protein